MPTDEVKNPQEKLKEVIQKAIESNIETIYFNGFTNSVGVGDVVIVLHRNGKPIAILNASYTVAKSLAIKLNELIGFLESKTDQKMLTTDQVEQHLMEKKK
jgi:hypothetical protein